MKIDRENYKYGSLSGWLLLICIFTPLFPTNVSPSAYNINFLFLFYFLCFLLLRRKLAINGMLIRVSFFFLAIQSFILLTYLFSSETLFVLSELVSVLRPLFMLFCIFTFLQLSSKVKSRNDFLEYVSGLYFPLAIIVFIYISLGLSEFIIGNYSFINFLYKRSYKYGIEHSATTFFEITYSSGFFGFSLLCLSIPTFLLLGKRRLLYLVSMLLILVVLLSQSKTMILSVLLFFPIYILLRKGGNKYIFTSMLALFIPVFLIYGKGFLIYILNYLSSDFIAARSFLRMINDPEQSGTLNVRIAQIVNTWKLLSESGYLLGVGLGRSLYLESWIAEILYRYGVIGFFIYLTGYVLVAISLFIRSLSKGSELYISLFIWFSFLFMNQLSGLLIESGKTMVLFCFMLSIIIKSLSIKIDN